MSKFFGAFSGNKKSDSGDITEAQVEAKDHVDYAKYFRLVDFGGNIVDVREQMRQAGLDDAIIHNPNKLIPAKPVIQKQQDSAPHILHRKASTAEIEDIQAEDSDFEDDESDGMSHGSSLVSGRSDMQQLAEENAFTNAFKKKKKTPIPSDESQIITTAHYEGIEEVMDKFHEGHGEVTKPEQSPDFEDDESDGMASHTSSHLSGGSGRHHAPTTVHSVSQPVKTTLSDIAKKQTTSTHRMNSDVFNAVAPQQEPASSHQEQDDKQIEGIIEVFIRKPLGLTLGENEPDEPMGVHVSKVVHGGSADRTGQIKPGMVLLTACGEDVTELDFDEVMDILRDAPKDEDLCLVFKEAREVDSKETNGNALEDSGIIGESDDDEPPSDDDDDDDFASDSDESPIKNDIWAENDLQQEAIVDQDEKKQDGQCDTIEVEATEVNDIAQEEYTSKGGEIETFSSSDNEEDGNTVVHVDPLARANSMFGGFSDSECSDNENDEGEEKLPIQEEIISRSNQQASNKQDTSPVVNSDVSSTSPDAPSTLPHTSSFKARRLAAMQSVRAKQAGGQPPYQMKAPDPLENTAIIGRVSAPPRRKPTAQRSSSLPPEQASPSGLPRRTKPAGQNADIDRRHKRMLGNDDDDNSTKDEIDKQTPSQSVSKQSPIDSTSTGIPRRKKSINVDPNERRYERFFGGGESEVPQKQDQQTHPQTHSQDVDSDNRQSTTASSELRMGTIKKTSSGYSLSGLSLGGVKQGNVVSDQHSTSSATPSSITSPDQNKAADDKVSQSAAVTVPRRRGGSSLTAQLKTIRSRRSMGYDNREITSPNSEKEPSDSHEKISRDNDNTATLKKSHPRSGKILNKQLNILWQKEGKAVIAKAKEEANPSRMIKEEERVKPEEFRRRRQSFSLTTPLDLGLDQDIVPESDERSLPSAVEEGSQSTTASSFAPSVTRKPVSTFPMDPALDLSSPSPVRSSNGGSPESVLRFQEGEGKVLSMWRDVDNNIVDDESTHDHSQVDISIGSGQHSPVKSDDDHLEQSSHNHSSFHSQHITKSEHNQQQKKDIIETIDSGCQSDYVNLIDDKYLNSYQMLLGEKQEVSEMQEKLYAEMKASKQQLQENEAVSKARVDAYEQESLERIAEEEALLRSRMEQVEDIILSEKQEIDKQWEELRAAEQEAYAVHAQKTQELLDLMHIVSAHHERVAGDKKKIARQRLHLDMALQDINRFTKFSPDMSGKIGTVKYVNTRTPAIGPSLSASVGQPPTPNVSKGFNSSATRLMPPPAPNRGGLSPSRHTTSSMQSIASFGSKNRRGSPVNKGRGLSRSQI